MTNELIERAKSNQRDSLISDYKTCLGIAILLNSGVVTFALHQLFNVTALWIDALIFWGVVIVSLIMITPVWIIFDLRVLIIDLHNRIEKLENGTSKKELEEAE
jgi:hypothetical protein